MKHYCLDNFTRKIESIRASLMCRSPPCVFIRWWMYPNASQMFPSGLKELGSTTLRTCSNMQTMTKWLSTLQVCIYLRVYYADEGIRN